MHTTNLRKVGGSIMLAVPPAILELLHLHAGSSVGISVDGDRLIVQTQSRPRYSIDELISECDPSQPFSKEDREWTDAPAVGRELI